MVHHCKACGEPAAKMCSGCSSKTWYCSSECQRTNWTFHIFDCNPRRPIDSSDYLALAVWRDTFPDDPQTCEDFGFDRALTAEDQSNLLGLYKGLIMYRRISSRKIHAWRVNGTLVDGIKRTFESLPKHAQGGYYAWFLENQWILDRSLPPSMASVDKMVRLAWAYAGGSAGLSTNDMVAHIKAWPDSKNSIFFFCSAILSHGRPHPMENNWVTLGFCVCHDEESELPLAAIYLDIIKRCTFEEFCTAYDTSSLIALFDANGLKARRERIPYLEDVLEGSPRSNKSVWNLKQIVSTEEVEMIPSVAVDYGFFNCKDTSEAQLLRDVYKQFFRRPGANPIKLHEAAIRGQLFEYVGGLLKMKNKERRTLQRLMVNPYPLKDL
ncbi:hypothetical protein BOTBODRAFT_269578 [Botryobasidium botryosum FD-172 SS1]|uniref:MYND-type domain-containing protein n=1 Tax=Botryobasidium botryosum (strain FD-172 SS1) TaxID=930990 RepID=A0A067MW87_BOTB1|nr:hypothetical protein BOTBODRAFT_269578 [Botryobasidium botryosum FD-172 SS1]